MNYTGLSTEINDYIIDYLQQNADKGLYYHNAVHAKYVAKSALKIAAGYDLDEDERFVLTVAAWFHDVGYVHGAQDHEFRSSEFAKNLLVAKGLSQEIIGRITTLIMATKEGHLPVSNLEEIIRDADFFHLGTNGFVKKNKLLHKEQEFLQQHRIDNKEWLTASVVFMKNHVYHTTFCKLGQSSKKERNIQLLQARILGLENKVKIIAKDNIAVVEREQKKKPDKSVDTVFKISSNNSQRLSNMADNKAHILITVNSIILSAMITLVMRKLGDNPYLILPTILILIVSLASMIFSIMATRPKVPRGTFSQQDLEDKQVNLLFFGNFYNMNLEKYREGMLMMMTDQDYLYNSLIKDIYFQGVVLGKKYAFLRMAYSVFMFGLIIAVAVFAIVSILHGQDSKIQ